MVAAYRFKPVITLLLLALLLVAVLLSLALARRYPASVAALVLDG